MRREVGFEGVENDCFCHIWMRLFSQLRFKLDLSREKWRMVLEHLSAFADSNAGRALRLSVGFGGIVSFLEVRQSLTLWKGYKKSSSWYCYQEELQRPTFANATAGDFFPRKKIKPGNDLLSREVPVSSALECLTTVFEMRTGMTTPPESPRAKKNWFCLALSDCSGF